MEFRDLKRQYQALKPAMDAAILETVASAGFIGGARVKALEERLAAYAGVKHCVTCGNGTDALQLMLMAWGIGPGDAVFVPDFTFFASGEAVAFVGATPVFYDVCPDTFNASAGSLENAIRAVLEEGVLTPKAVITVDLYGLPADYPAIEAVAEQYGLKVLEDAAHALSAGGLQQGLQLVHGLLRGRLLRREHVGIESGQDGFFLCDFFLWLHSILLNLAL